MHKSAGGGDKRQLSVWYQRCLHMAMQLCRTWCKIRPKLPLFT